MGEIQFDIKHVTGEYKNQKELLSIQKMDKGKRKMI